MERVRRIEWGYRLALFVLAALLYAPSVRNGFVYDDETLILKESRPDSLRAFTEVFDQRHFPGLPYYRPATRLTFRVQKFLHGDDPAPYHALNVGLIGLAACAAFGLLRGAPFQLGAPAAAAASFLFICHPTASSCVYPVCSGRETLLPALLMLLAMGAWLRTGWRARAAAAGWWGLALFAKEQAVVLPALFLLADVLDLNGEGRWRHKAREAAWFGAMGLAGVGYVTLRMGLFGSSEYVWQVLADPAGPAWSYLYGLQTFWAPFARLVYEPPVAIWFSAWRSGLALLATGAMAVWAYRTRGATGRGMLFWAAWFVLLQLPTANLLRQEARFDERYVFLAGLAFPAAAMTLLSREPRARRRAAAWGGVAVLALAWGLISFRRAAVFADDLAFSRQWAATNPGSATALNNVGNVLLNRGQLEEAEGYLSRAVAADPGLAAARYNLGTTLYRLGRLGDAVAQFREALRLDPTYKADYNLALALAATGHTEEAMRRYRMAAAKDPGNADIPYNLGLLLAQRGETDAALTEFRAAARLGPRDPRPCFNMGVALERAGRLDEAVAAYEEARSRDPRYADARFNLGNLYVRKGRWTEAVAEYEAAVRANPGDVQSRRNLDAARAMAAGQGEAAPVPPAGGR